VPTATVKATRPPVKASSDAAAAATASTPVPPRPTTPPAAAADAPRPASRMDAAVSSEPPVATDAEVNALAPSRPVSPGERSAHDDRAALSGHLLQIWTGLSPDEQRRAERLAGRLTTEERTAWFGELAATSVVDAIARVRHILGLYTPDAGGGS